MEFRKRLFWTLGVIVLVLGVATINVAWADVVHGGGNYSGPLIWRASDNVHIVTGNITIQGTGSLTIEPGCEVRFDANTLLNISGTLNAVGTSGQEILFTRRDADDQWRGLTFQSGSSGHLAYCTIEYATAYDGAAVYANGSLPTIEHCTLRDNDYGIYVHGVTNPNLSVANTIQDNLICGLYFYQCTNPSVSNQTLTGHMAVNGAVYMASTGAFHMGSGNTITGNSWGLTANIGSYPDQTSIGNIPLSGNTNNDGLQINGGNTSDSVHWYDVGADFIMTGAGTIHNAGQLDIWPDVTAKFDEHVMLNVSGTVNANGIAGHGVLLTRRDAGEGWRGLTYQATSSGSLEYCTIEYVTSYDGSAVYANGSLPDIKHCTLRYNDYGMFVTSVTNPTLSTANTIYDNSICGLYFTQCTNPSVSNQTLSGHMATNGAIYMASTGAFHMGGGNTITGNSWGLTTNIGSYPDEASSGNIPLSGNTYNDGIQVNGGNTASAVHWYDVGADFIVTGTSTITSAGQLDVWPNVTAKFDENVQMNISGTLNANGTSGQGVLLTRRDAGEGWRGLTYQSTSSGTVSYCTIEHATAYDGSAIYANGSLPDIEHCTLRYNDYGVFITSVSDPTLSVANNIHDNSICGLYFTQCTNPRVSNQTLTGHVAANGAVYMASTGAFHMGTGNTITGNSWGLTTNIGSYPDPASSGNIPVSGNTNSDGLQVNGGNTAFSVNWYDVGTDFIVTGACTISAAGELNIWPDVTAKFDENVIVNISGITNVNGTSGHEVLLTRRDVGEGWRGFTYQSSSSGTVAYGIIEHATAYDGSAIYGNGFLPNIEHCVLRYNDYGVFGHSITNPTLSVANTIYDNNICGLYFTQCTNPSISNQTLTGHTGLNGAVYMASTGAFHLGSGNTITGNSWGLTTNIGSYPDQTSIGNIPLAGNTNTDGIQVNGGNTASVVQWYDVGADFIITGTCIVSAAGDLNIWPDVTAKFDEHVLVNISGTLDVNGTAGAGVLLTRRNLGEAWRGVTFQPGSTGDLEHCTIEYVTSYDGSAIYCNGASPSLTACTLRYSDNGVYMNNGSPSLINCIVTDNYNYGLYLQGASHPMFGSSLAQWNDIYNNGLGDPDRDLRNGTENLSAAYVYWGTTVQSQVQNRIHHQPDNAGLGLVFFSPWINAAHDQTYASSISVEPDPHEVPKPKVYALGQNYPNPFNPSTTINYALPEDGHVVLTIIDLAGRRVATVVDGFQAAGYKSIQWNGSHLGSGVYLYRIEADGFEQVRKMNLVK